MPGEAERIGVCLGLTELMGAAGKDLVLQFLDDLLPAVRLALCDGCDAVREAASSALLALSQSRDGCSTLMEHDGIVDALVAASPSGALALAFFLDEDASEAFATAALRAETERVRAPTGFFWKVNNWVVHPFSGDVMPGCLALELLCISMHSIFRHGVSPKRQRLRSSQVCQ